MLQLSLAQPQTKQNIGFIKYNLAHPLNYLSSPLSKERYKTLVKSHIINYWEKILRAEAAPLSSLEFFKPSFMSLKSPHPIWSTAGASPAQVVKATIQAQMLSGRYRTQHLCSLWSLHTSEFCQLAPSCLNTPEDIHHILRNCEALSSTREDLLRFATNYSTNCEPVHVIVTTFCHPSHPKFCQFLLDCSVLPEIIGATQIHRKEVLKHLFHITRKQD